MFGVGKLVPAAMAEPPLLAVNQLMVPPTQPDAVSVTEPVPQRLFPLVVGAEGTGLTVAVTATLLEGHAPTIQLI